MISEDGFLIEVLLVAVLVLLNGFFAGAEIAVITAPLARVQARAARGDRKAQALLRLKAEPDRFLATVQIGVTLVGTLASAVGGVAAIERLEPLFAALPWHWAAAVAEPLAVGSVVLTLAYCSLVIGELVPKSLAVRHAETISLSVARPIEGLSRLARGAVSLLTASSRCVLALLRQKPDAASPFTTIEDLKALVRSAESAGVLESQIVTGALRFHDTEVRNVLTPRNRIAGIPLDATLREALEIAAASGHSRLPLYEGDIDHVVGIVFARDLLEASLGNEPVDMASLAHHVILVPTSKSAAELLGEMRSLRCQMAMAVDEHGSTLGLVTLEDLIEVIVGDIQDENQVPAPEARRLADGNIEADGSLSVRRINAQFGLELPESPSYVTLAGLVLARLGTIPRGGERIESPPYVIDVVAMEGRRIATLRLTRSGPPPAEASTAGPERA